MAVVIAAGAAKATVYGAKNDAKYAAARQTFKAVTPRKHDAQIIATVRIIF